MKKSSMRAGSAIAEMIAGLVGLGLIATLITGAYAGVRQRRQVDAASARLEEAQNLLAGWRAGGGVTEAGWTSVVRRHDAGSEVLTLRGYGVQLSTVRPVADQP